MARTKNVTKRDASPPRPVNLNKYSGDPVTRADWSPSPLIKNTQAAITTLVHNELRHKLPRRVAVLHFEGDGVKDSSIFVIPEDVLEPVDWDVFAYWTSLENVHTQAKKKTPKLLVINEEKCYCLLFTRHNPEVLPPWHRYKQDARHIGFDTPSEHFKISVF